MTQGPTFPGDFPGDERAAEPPHGYIQGGPYFRDHQPDPPTPGGFGPPPFPPDEEPPCEHPNIQYGVCRTCVQTLTVEIDFEVTVSTHASMTPDEARALFGLGGTPDDNLLRIVRILAAHGHIPAGIDEHVTKALPHGRQLVVMRGADYLGECGL